MAIASRIQKRVLASFAAAAAAKLPEAAVAAAAGAEAAVEEVASVQAAQGGQVLEFGDTGRLFAGERSASLVRTLAVLQALSVGPLVDVATAALRSPAVAGSAVGRAAARATAYQHFCAGETAEEAAAAVRRLWRGGMGGILDYGIEDAEDGPACDRNAAGFLAAIDVAAALPPGSASVCIKITALCPIALLEKASDLLRWQQKHPSLQLPWKAHGFPVLCDSSPLYLTASEPPALTAEEERELELAHGRLLAIGERCAEYDIPLLVDAEYATVQPAIDYFTFAGALAFNGGGRPIIHGTIQAYLRDARDRLEAMARAADGERVCLALKVVRGAYLAREARLAASLGVPSPIHASIQDTHDCYNGCAAFLLDRVRRGAAAVTLATHNVESGQLAAARAQELGIGRGDRGLQFAQLMGMADGLSLGLRNAGFQVSKYLPYGPVEHIIPYLIRRAEENRGLLSSSSFDRQLLRKELARRFKAAMLGRE
ncbi:proline dehydrogenase 2, mitochondrial-like [Oryza brachyantha]|uniref:proline dehydrogenase 2, mitochondrial-like n=1 Tax=Oryza brachyantha TaxID=4533 RepID=UPI001AD95685|nr:proline dehydrogenase 2, mitochondrial-like [Oryza brachyantha]